MASGINPSNINLRANAINIIIKNIVTSLINGGVGPFLSGCNLPIRNTTPVLNMILKLAKNSKSKLQIPILYSSKGTGLYEYFINLILSVYISKAFQTKPINIDAGNNGANSPNKPD